MAAPEVEFAALFSRPQTVQHRYSKTSVTVTGVPEMLTPAGLNPLAPRCVQVLYGMDAFTGDVTNISIEVIGERRGRWAARSYWRSNAVRRLSVSSDRALLDEADVPDWLRWLVARYWPEAGA